MTERRPHWTDELIEAVTESIPGPFPEIVIYSVIAAVEDWQEARWGPECWVTTAEDAKALFLYRAQTAEAKIQVVRDVCEDYFHDRSDLDAVESLEAIRRALDGPQ